MFLTLSLSLRGGGYAYVPARNGSVSLGKREGKSTAGRSRSHVGEEEGQRGVRLHTHGRRGEGKRSNKNDSDLHVDVSAPVHYSIYEWLCSFIYVCLTPALSMIRGAIINYLCSLSVLPQYCLAIHV